MANKFLKGQQIANMAIGLLQREIMFPGLVWQASRDDFALSAGDTMTIRVPARTVARRRPLRGARQRPGYGTGIIEMDTLSETHVDVTLDEDVYNAVPITDEEMTLDITNFGEQVAKPQARAVAEGLEDKLVEKVLAAPYVERLTLDTAEPYNTAVDATTFLNRHKVARTDRFMVVGADMEGVFLKSDKLSDVDRSGSDSTLRDALIGRLAGFGDVYVCNGLPPDFGVAFHRTAFCMGMVAPVVPDGASAGGVTSEDGMSIRWIRDYDFGNVQDRSLLDCYAGSNWVVDHDGPNETQTITVEGSPSGGNFTLSYAGATTGNIAYNASASAVQTALRGLSTVNADGLTVTGSAGTYTVKISSYKAAQQIVANGAGLTGGTNPKVTAVSAEAGADGTSKFVRAVAIDLA